MKKVFILIVLALIVTGCASQINEKMQSWVGHHKSELIASWGPPNQYASDGRDGEILIYGSYVNLGQTPGQATNNYYGGVSYTAPQQNGYQRTRMFYVDAGGNIYSWRWKGM